LLARDSSFEDDRELVDRCKKGEELAFEELVRKYQQTIFNLVYHNMGYTNDIEDISQKVFSKVYFSLPKFDNRRPFIPWLYRIALNQCYDELRRARRRKIHTFTELSLVDTDSIEKLMNQNDSQPGSDEDSKEMYALLRKTLDQLPAPQRTAILLRDIEYIAYNQMAEILQCTEQAARLKVFRARARLKELMEKALHRRGK
jgi:RNA polymerase sigma-70 factor, ECF subfamily